MYKIILWVKLHLNVRDDWNQSTIVGIDADIFDYDYDYDIANYSNYSDFANTLFDYNTEVSIIGYRLKNTSKNESNYGYVYHRVLFE